MDARLGLGKNGCVIDTGVQSQVTRPARPRSLADPFYYLCNFERVIHSLDARYAPLWSAEERQFIATFSLLPREARALLVRMVIRKGALFRASRLNYPEIGATPAAVAPLLELGWVEQRSTIDFEDLVRLFTKAQLLEHFAPPGLGREVSKGELISILRPRYPEAVPLLAWQCETGDRVYCLRIAALCELLRLMFFGNFHQDWSEFVLADLGLFKYEKIPHSLQSAAFTTRAQIEALSQLQRCREDLDADKDPALIRAQMPPPLEDCGWIEVLRRRLLYKIARADERKCDWASALLGYSNCQVRDARIRAIRIHERARRFDHARALCLAAADCPDGAVERDYAKRALLRIDRKLGMDGARTVPKTRLPSFELAPGSATAQTRVEHYVRDQLMLGSDGRTSVHYVENSLVPSLFGLLCWKPIFEPLPGAFFHDFQRGPADLLSDHFYDRRRAAFDDCFAQLSGDQYQATIRRCYADKKGVQSPVVSWGSLSEALLEKALACFPAAHLRLWFEWIVADLQDNRAGFPDLVQFWPIERRYRLIEVKGPGDRLQGNQRRLLEYCVSHQMPVAVCYLR
jgi:hypothetical protein